VGRTLAKLTFISWAASWLLLLISAILLWVTLLNWLSVERGYLSSCLALSFISRLFSQRLSKVTHDKNENRMAERLRRYVSAANSATGTNEDSCELTVDPTVQHESRRLGADLYFALKLLYKCQSELNFGKE
jgi:hypothetical protein